MQVLDKTVRERLEKRIVEMRDKVVDIGGQVKGKAIEIGEEIHDVAIDLEGQIQDTIEKELGMDEGDSAD